MREKINCTKNIRENNYIDTGRRSIERKTNNNIFKRIEKNPTESFYFYINRNEFH